MPIPLYKNLSLNKKDYQKICRSLKRAPNKDELQIYNALWSEHCCYKSTKYWLKLLDCEAPHVIQGRGENAGAIDIGNGECLVFKMESHNHPSYLSPFQGAASGMGGILRDIVAMGARPIVAMNALHFGEFHHPKTANFLKKTVAGIGSYANSFGVATLGGQTRFRACYNDNILVNAFAAGITSHQKLLRAKAPGAGLKIFYLGAKTGQDGIGGADMASQSFGENNDAPLHTIQIANPFIGHCLMEALMEAIEQKALLALQDLGAAGLCGAAVELAAKKKLGVKLCLDNVPLHNKTMTVSEILLSESQERFLLILDPKKQLVAQKIFAKWHLNFAEIGEILSEPVFYVKHKKRLALRLPIEDFYQNIPHEKHAYQIPSSLKIILPEAIPQVKDLNKTLLTLLSDPNHGSKAWIYEQYDQFIQGRTLKSAGFGAGVIYLQEHKKALAFSCDGIARYCFADPFEGAKQAVAQCWRHLNAVGAKPLALSDSLNFGSPKNPFVMGQIIQTIKGIACAAKFLEFPVISGNISLYNETNNKPIWPTPIIAGVGIIEDPKRLIGFNRLKDEDRLFLIGKKGQTLSCSLYQDQVSAQQGAPAPIDLNLEKNHGTFVRLLIEKGLIHYCQALSEGGLAIGLAKMAIFSQKGMIISLDQKHYPKEIIHARLFGEDQGRYVISMPHHYESKILSYAKQYSIEMHNLGKVAGTKLSLLPYIDIEVKDLAQSFESWFANFTNK